MKIGIEAKTTAYIPEAPAYKNYLEKKGHIVQSAYPKDFDEDNDINILFMGVDPFWSKTNKKAKVIHEYNSLSTSLGLLTSLPISKIKNLIKKTINKTPDGRIFSEIVIKEHLNFLDNIPYIFRPVGVEENLFHPMSRIKKYNIVYCGSIDRRPGLAKQINKLCDLGFNIIVAGKYSKNSKSQFTNSNNITLAGMLPKTQEFYELSKFGFNYTPNIYPLNIQTSIKTLEYFACGLPVISNRYCWIEDFCRKKSQCKSHMVRKIAYPLADDYISSLNKKYCWDFILDDSNLNDFLIRAVSTS